MDEPSEIGSPQDHFSRRLVTAPKPAMARLCGRRGDVMNSSFSGPRCQATYASPPSDGKSGFPRFCRCMPLDAVRLSRSKVIRGSLSVGLTYLRRSSLVAASRRMRLPAS